MRNIEDHWDHERDLRKHEPRPGDRGAEVTSQSDPEVPGLTGHIITGFSEQDVQAAINRLLFQFDTNPGEGEFTRPRRIQGRWHAIGWTRVGRVA